MEQGTGPEANAVRTHPGYKSFPSGFFTRADDTDDRVFYERPRLVTHIDDNAIAAVGELYDRLGIRDAVLDLMSSWISHFSEAPAELTVLGLNAVELDANPVATKRIVQDLNVDPKLPFTTDSFDHAVCCVSVDYLTQPLEVFEEVARVVRPGGRFVCTFSNRCFPTKAIRGWHLTDDNGHTQIVAAYFETAGSWSDDPVTEVIVPAGFGPDPLLAVHAEVAPPDNSQ